MDSAALFSNSSAGPHPHRARRIRGLHLAVFISLLGQLSWSPAPAQDLNVPHHLRVCEGQDHQICGTWTFTGSQGTGRWDNGAIADLIVQQFDPNWIIIRRSDQPGSATSGLTAIYRGKLSGPRIEGTVTWTWLGHWNKQVDGIWSASLNDSESPVPMPDPPYTGAGPPPRVSDRPDGAVAAIPKGLPPIMHWCSEHCITLVWQTDHYTNAAAPGHSIVTVESFTPESVVLHRTDFKPMGTAVLTGKLSPRGDAIIDGTITWTAHPCCGLGSALFTAAWGAALDTVPGSDEERARRLQPSQEEGPRGALGLYGEADPPQATIAAKPAPPRQASNTERGRAQELALRAAAHCYRFTSSKGGASVTIQIAHLPAPKVTSNPPGYDTYLYDLANLPGNRFSGTLNATTASGGDTFGLEVARDLEFSVTLQAFQALGTTLRLVAKGGPDGMPTVVILLFAQAGDLLPNGLPSRLPPASAWSLRTLAVYSVNPKGEIVVNSGQIDAIDDSCGAPPSAKTAPAPLTASRTIPPSPPSDLPTLEEMRPYPAYGTKEAAAPETGTPDANPLGQTPFHIRDLFLLEDRMLRVRNSNDQYSAGHSEIALSNRAQSPAQPFLPDVSNPAIYRGRWMEVVSEADRFWAMGGFEVAEKRFRLVLGMLRKVHGPDSDAVAMMLDHIGEFYLDERDFAGAYATLTEAVKVRRKTLAAIPAPPAGTVATAESDTRSTYRLHLAELLTRLGQMDLSRGALDAAALELAEAVAIGNEPAHRNYVNSLFAVYFQSVLWERQGKRQEAEALWRDAIARRAPLGDSVAFWSAQKELALFQARHGNFRAAAETARKIAAETAGKHLTSEEEMPYTSNWPRTNQALYWRESTIAMSEILAIDAWQSAGPEAAVKLLQEPIDRTSDLILNSGAASERARLVTLFERRVFLHLSLLLDGDPSPERVKAAYELLCRIKGRYLASETYVHRLYESERGNPHVEDPAHLAELDQLADIRQQIAHRFITNAVDAKPVTGAELAALETQERTVSRALASDAWMRMPTSFFVPLQGSELDDGTVVIDAFKWRRWDRQTATVLPEEYGAFVTRRGEATRYVSLGPAAPIDRDIKTLTAPGQAVSRELLQQLYQHLLAPIESRLSGGIRRVLIVPDGLLTLAPFGALLDEKGGFLLERATVGYLNSVYDLRAADRSEPASTSPAVIVANPDFNLILGVAPPTAPSEPRIDSFTFAGGGHFEKEAHSVAEHLGAANRIVTGKMAREELIASLSGPEVLHLATHSKPNIQWRAPVPAWSLWEYPQPLTTNNPALQSLIALAGASREQSGIEDGFLTGLEVEGLHLVGTKLVVLSSCEAGQEQPVNGEGVLGLRSAFAMAGADGVVTNLWKVDDEAGRKFMDFFYSHLRDGADAAEALRQAQLQMVRDTSYSAPFYWAGYQYAGKPTPLRVVRSPGAQPQPASDQATLVAPHCFEVTAREAPDGSWQSIETVRVKLGAEAHRRSLSATRAVYELASPGSDAEETWSTSVNGGPPIPSHDVRTASQVGWGITLAVERHPDWSGLTIMIGKKDEPVLTLKLKGPPSLFPSLDFPREIPPLSSYKEATLWTDVAAKIEAIDVCRGGSLR